MRPNPFETAVSRIATQPPVELVKLLRAVLLSLIAITAASSGRAQSPGDYGLTCNVDITELRTRINGGALVPGEVACIFPGDTGTASTPPSVFDPLSDPLTYNTGDPGLVVAQGATLYIAPGTDFQLQGSISTVGQMIFDYTATDGSARLVNFGTFTCATRPGVPSDPAGPQRIVFAGAPDAFEVSGPGVVVPPTVPERDAAGGDSGNTIVPLTAASFNNLASSVCPLQSAQIAFAPSDPPVANDDEDLNNPVGDTITGLDLLDDDLLGDGSTPAPGDVTVDLDPVTAGDQTTLSNADGTYTYNPVNGQLEFVPNATLIASGGNPAVIPYTLTETATGLSDTANITITYADAPVANDDEDLNNPVGDTITGLDLLDDDLLGDGSTPAPGDVTVDLDPVTAGDQTTLSNADGTYTYNPVNGQLEFVPNATLIASGGNPAVIPYTLTETATGLSDTANITITYADASIELVKSVSSISDTNGSGVFGDPGDTVNYSFTAENTGDTALAGVTVSDTDLDGLDGAFVLTQPVVGFDGDLAIGEGPVEVATATYVLADSDIAAGSITNTADVTSTAVETDIGGDPDPALPLPGFDPVVDASDTGTEPTLDRSTGTVPDVPDPAGTGTGDDPTVLTLQSAGEFMLTKSTPATQVLIGQTISYEIVATSMMAVDFGPVEVIDTLPDGLAFVPDSATVDGAASEPTVSGRSITFSDLTIPANDDLTIVLQARVLTSAPAGTLTNTVSLLDALTGEALAETASAAVSRTVESTFDCSPVIGKVFDDVNMDGYQDVVPDVRAQITDQDIFIDKLGEGGKLADAVVEQTEVGIPGVRLVTPTGTTITTDTFGRYSVPCAEIPTDIGSNFMLKLDTRTLPTGYRVTTENPRVMRLTSGLMTEMNFGAALGRVFDVDLSARAYSGGEVVPSQGLANGLESVLRQIADTPTVIRIAYYRDGEGSELAHARLDAVEALIQEQWAGIGNYQLLIEKTVMQLQ